MYSDTHFHFLYLTRDAGFDGSSVLELMAERGAAFGQDIGTRCSDLHERQVSVQQAITGINSPELGKKAEQFMHFSAGIWPDPEAISDRRKQLPELERQITTAVSSDVPLFRKITAIGECGLDHHWNPAGVDGRSEQDFSASMFAGERELFQMQLELAERMNLPVIVHSRDAFQDTFDCISEVGYDRGIIHCYSYGCEEARAFLDRGWYISLSGSVTYTKKSKMDTMRELLRFIPDDRILLETDAPYLAPVPMRGTSNTPNYIEYTYKFIAENRGVSVESLCDTVDSNSRVLFAL